VAVRRVAGLTRRQIPRGFAARIAGMTTNDENEPQHDAEPGAENGHSDAKDALPGKPEGDKDADLGDTDQHSSSDS
jgi:hypothetical protein